MDAKGNVPITCECAMKPWVLALIVIALLIPVGGCVAGCIWRCRKRSRRPEYQNSPPAVAMHPVIPGSGPVSATLPQAPLAP